MYSVDLDRARRADIGSNMTGVFARAVYKDKPISCDIWFLDRVSLLKWLRSRGGRNDWAEQAVAGLLGWESYTDEELNG